MVPLPRIGSLALRLARIAHGDADIAIVGGSSHDWDLAAADLLVHEAGGMLTDLDGKPLTYNRPEPVHGLLGCRRALAPCAGCLNLVRERKAQFAESELRRGARKWPSNPHNCCISFSVAN